VHQVNIEYLASVVMERGRTGEGAGEDISVAYPDTCVGTDSHTTMINGIGVAGWGVGGIEAEAGMLGQPLYFLTPDVVGVKLTGSLREGVTATDLVLTITQRLRQEKVVGAFVEFFGEGVASLSVPDRAAIANMAPEYGATMGFFPVDAVTVDYLRISGRTAVETAAFASYFKAQGMYGIPGEGEVDYSRVLEFDLSAVRASVSGPRRPQDRIELNGLKDRFEELFTGEQLSGGFGKKAEDLTKRYRTTDGIDVGSGDVVIAAITSCTNTSNPAVLLSAGLLAKKAVERGLSVKRYIKTSLAPGSRVVTEYLQKAGLLTYLEYLGFYLAAYGCTTCIGNSGPLEGGIEKAIIDYDLVCASVLSGNRNFEARIHPNLRANFLMSPPLVVAFAIAGTVLRDMESDPLGAGADGHDVYLRDIWPSEEEIADVMRYALDPETYRRLYSDIPGGNPLWNSLESEKGKVYHWPESAYIAEPPFFNEFKQGSPEVRDIEGARALAIFGDSLTTDHISPAGPIPESSPAGRYLAERGVKKEDFQSYGTRRGNHEVMVRGTFANVRIRNFMMASGSDGKVEEGGFTAFQPSGEEMSIFDAAMKYRSMGTPSLVFGGEEYGTGSSRDWAAKGPKLLGVRAVVAKSFERIHRSNLVGMGILPLQFTGDDSVTSLHIKGTEEFDILGLEDLIPPKEVTLVIRSSDGNRRLVKLLSRIDTATEADYFKHGGILPYVLRKLALK